MILLPVYLIITDKKFSEQKKDKYFVTPVTIAFPCDTHINNKKGRL